MKKDKWEILDSEYLIKRPWLTARKDKVRLPDGRVNPEHYVLEYPDWVNVIAITDEGQFVMVEQYRHGLQDYYIELVAGVAEEGETMLEAVRRELLEESGYGGGEWQLLCVIAQNPSTCNNYTHCFLAKGVKRVAGQNLDATEDVAVRLLTREEVLSMLMADEMKQSLMAAPLWKYFALEGNL